ncbi:MAG: hypothetical protein KME52_24130 [Desmonostoc geniculatum HA4340-LM1]|jgi:hypothetical protein|nr:hypothetical protein [Desmonostoc geniculatum HA4340-LM1]
MSNLGLGNINRNSNNPQQNKPIWGWVFVVCSVQIFAGFITVLANLAKIADSTEQLCKKYDIALTQSLCQKLKEMQKTNPIDLPPQGSQIPTSTPKYDTFPTKEPQQQDTQIPVNKTENIPKFRRWEPEKTGIATETTSNFPKFHRLQKTIEPQPGLPTFRRLKDKSNEK